jgi:hypothetical protein
MKNLKEIMKEVLDKASESAAKSFFESNKGQEIKSEANSMAEGLGKQAAEVANNVLTWIKPEDRLKEHLERAFGSEEEREKQKREQEKNLLPAQKKRKQALRERHAEVRNRLGLKAQGNKENTRPSSSPAEAIKPVKEVTQQGVSDRIYESLGLVAAMLRETDHPSEADAINLIVEKQDWDKVSLESIKARISGGQTDRGAKLAHFLIRAEILHAELKQLTQKKPGALSSMKNKEHEGLKGGLEKINERVKSLRADIVDSRSMHLSYVALFSEGPPQAKKSRPATSRLVRAVKGLVTRGNP